MRKPKYNVGQVVWEKENHTYVRISRILKSGLMIVERFGNKWPVLPSEIRPLTKRERGA